MISDESSSDSETGRFKSHSKSEKRTSKNLSSKPISKRDLPDLKTETDRSFRRDFDRRHDDRRRSRDRFESSRRQSPPRRKDLHERISGRAHSPGRHKLSRDTDHSRSRTRDVKEIKDIKQSTKSPQRKTEEGGRNFREEIRKNIVTNVSKDKTGEKDKRLDQPKSRERECSTSKRRDRSPIEFRRSSSKKLEVIKPVPIQKISPKKEKSISVEKESSKSKGRRYSEKVQESEDDRPASYYNMVPSKEKGTVETIHSVTDSSEDEVKLRAKLLNLEKELHKTKRKKTKKHKKKSKSNDKDRDDQDQVEVSSTTDIKKKTLDDNDRDSESQAEVVSSTQSKHGQESSEEGEISSDEDRKATFEITDLRHRIKQSTAPAVSTSGSSDPKTKSNVKRDVAGPALPPHMQKKAKHSSSIELERPALPPQLNVSRKNIGPSLPIEMRKVLAEASDDRPSIKYISSDEDDGIGPLPAGAEEKWTIAHKKLEERALDMKIRSLEGGSRRSDVKSREEWMLELPEGKAKIIGLGPRQFRSKEGPDMSDRSSWTDTPQQKALKAAGLAPAEEASSATLQRDAHNRYIEDRDHDQERAVKKHKKKHRREESLLEMHEKKLKKKKKKEEKDEGTKRRPFDRDIDLGVNRFDDAQKKSIIKKAQHLDSRFSRGEAKYL